MPDCSHPVIALGTVVPMSKVEGSLILPVDDSIQVWRPDVESAWLSLPAPVWLSSTPPPRCQPHSWCLTGSINILSHDCMIIDQCIH